MKWQGVKVEGLTPRRKGVSSITLRCIEATAFAKLESIYPRA